MSTEVKLRRGSTNELALFTPALAEIVVDTTRNRLKLGDGVTVGGQDVTNPDTVFNIETYGAVGDNTTDNKVAINAAIAALGVAGGGALYIPTTGTFRTSGNHTLHSNMTVLGSGYASCLKGIYDADLDTGTPVFNYINPLRPTIGITNVTFKNVRIEGVWDEVYRELSSANSEIVIVGVDGFIMENCWIKNSCFGNLVLNQCKNAHIRNSFFMDSARDMCRLWNCDNSSVIGNTFLRNDDDCISINMAGFESVDGRPRQGILIQGNYLQDTGAIRIQSAKNCIIDGNVIKLNKGGYAIAVEGISTAEVYETNVHSTIISNNTILDTIERLLAREQADSMFSNLRVGIKVASGDWSVDSSDLTNTYNHFNTTTGAAGTDPQRVNEGLLITGNIIKRTLPATANYSDWGYGKMFSRFKDTEVVAGYIVNGEANPVILDQHLSCRSLEIRDGLQHSTISDNHFEGTGVEGIRFNVGRTTAANFHFRGLTIINNVIKDFRNVGIDLNTDYGGTVQDITIEGNIIDGDPYFKDVERGGFGGTLTGGWTASDDCQGINSLTVRGLKVLRNTFSNLSLCYTFGGTKQQNTILGNLIIGEPDPSTNPRTFATTHLGVGQYPADMDYEATLVYTDSDPLSATYSEQLMQQLKSVASIPTAGYFFDGQIVYLRGAVPSVGFTAFAYRRLTDGTGHVSGTDWEVLKASV